MSYMLENTPKAKLDKACRMVSDCTCALSFIDCGEVYEVSEGDMQPLHLSLEQVSGILLVLESVANRARDIKALVIEASPLVEKTHAVCQWVDKFLSVIDVALRLARINLADDGDQSEDGINVDRLWVTGFFCTLRHTTDQTDKLYQAVCDIWEALPESSRGGELAENT